jgi:N utilization substance protein B
MAKITRRAARECAVQTLYAYGFNKDTDKAEFYESICREYEDADVIANDFTKELFFGVCDHVEEIDEKIKENLRGWTFERVARISLSVMRMGAYELMFTDIPVSAAINEAIEVDKKYDKDDASRFINGVLNAIAKACRAK